jgi:hypothetical protein
MIECKCKGNDNHCPDCNGWGWIKEKDGDVYIFQSRARLLLFNNYETIRNGGPLYYIFHEILKQKRMLLKKKRIGKTDLK